MAAFGLGGYTALAYHLNKEVRQVRDYVRSVATEKPIIEGTEQVLIFGKESFLFTERYRGVGMIRISPAGTCKLLTAEHMLPTPSEGGMYFRVERIRPSSDTRPLFFQKVIARGSQLPGNHDYLVVLVGHERVRISDTYNSPSRTKPKGKLMMSPYSEIGMAIMQSALSGEHARIIGTAVYPGESPDRVVIDYVSRHGQSGTVFIDEKHRFWITAGGLSDGQTLSEVQDAYLRLGGKLITGLTTLSGPVEVDFE